MSITIKDVAKQANVSVATVSRILNNLPGYSDETQQRVKKVIKELGYQPNAVARGLINRKTKTIGVLVPNVSDLFASEVLAGIEEQAHEFGYSVMICKTNHDGKRTINYLHALYEKRVDGIIIVSEFITLDYYKAIETNNVPVVLVATQSDYPLPFIKVDDYQAAYDATTYLVKKGHSHIGMIAGTKSDAISTTPRVKGFTDALNDVGITVTNEMITYGDFSFKSGIEGMDKLLKSYPKVKAVFCASDEMAVGALSLLYKRGIRVPERISLIGYDNTATAEKAIPPLTTVAQPLYKMGKDSIQLLLNPALKVNPLYPHHIAERDTVHSYSE
ncbi:LacI family DNA-binding transcriptional regulator [Peribacillus muralis]|uniref:LacI family DNA-binding transcriptional regulator n=1 Tax=Peribacillus muralis TaxID=264697 RepID=UPI00070CC497|nr:LacI family DNA-binding transcriptional regulator [Peribacillus muralis]MCK1995018.1 LacI family transcriptional regulator [Peribacillus muralis]MCK2015611.1 LacI family transcriptional regulator [Peribacillus muralis]